MSALPNLSSIQRMLLIGLDGLWIPGARQELVEAGFAGRLRVITHGDWSVVAEGKCERVLALPHAASGRLGRGLRFAGALASQWSWAEALLWIGPPDVRFRAVARLIARCKPVYTFYGGHLARYDATRRPGPPEQFAISLREQRVAIQHLRPLLAGAATAADAAPRPVIALDGEGLNLRAATGVQWYRRHLLAALCAPDGGVDLRVTSPASEARCVWELPWTQAIRRIPPTIHGIPSTAMDDAEPALPIELVTGPVDLLHLTFFERPRLATRPCVATVYDIIPLLHPELFPAPFVRRLEQMAPVWRAYCDRLICISEATRQDVMQHLAIDPARTVVIPPGRHAQFHPRSQDEIADALHRYGIEPPYVMAVGSLAPHKNLARLCEAFAIARRRGNLPHRLVLAGPPAWLTEQVLETIRSSRLADALVFAGYVDWSDLPALYSGADAFCMPSLNEGYGLPVQEAICCGCPVITSRTGALAEVAGEAAQYWDPHRADDMADKLLTLLTAGDPRQAWGNALARRAAQFPGWEAVARTHVQLYREVIAAHGSESRSTPARSSSMQEPFHV